MKITCNQKSLYGAIQTVNRAVSARASLPILTHIVMNAQGDNLQLMATDLEIWMQCSTEATVEESGAVTVPARVISEILAALPGEDVTIERKEDKRIGISCGAIQYELLTLEPADFPNSPEVEVEASFTIKPQDLQTLVERTLYAVAEDRSRATLTGVLLTLDNSTLKAVSTDTHRLCLVTTEVMNVSTTDTASMKYIVPSKTMGEVGRLAAKLAPDDGVNIATSSNQIIFEIGNVRLTSRLIEGEFPNYERVIPTEYQKKLIIPTEPFRAAVKRAAIVARDDANRVVFRTDGSVLRLSAESPYVGTASEEVDVEREGDDVNMAFNAKYLLDFLATINAEVIEMELTGELNAALARPQGVYDYTYVLMPMQIMAKG